MKSTTKNPAKSLVGQSAFYGLIFLGSIFLLLAIFTWMMKTYSLEVAFMAIGIILMSGAFIIKFEQWRNRPKLKSETKKLPQNIENDPLATHIPDSLKDDPVLKKILVEISEKPLVATATALTVGMVLAREYFD